MKKKSMSVLEMARILGIKKTDSYWLIKRKFFKVIVVAGNMRVMIDSFEEWYDNQVHYKKANGTPPGKKLNVTTMSVLEAANLLGVSQSTIYSLIGQTECIKTIKSGIHRRIERKSFEEWYQSQNKYKKVGESEGQ